MPLALIFKVMDNKTECKTLITSPGLVLGVEPFPLQPSVIPLGSQPTERKVCYPKENRYLLMFFLFSLWIKFLTTSFLSPRFDLVSNFVVAPVSRFPPSQLMSWNQNCNQWSDTQPIQAQRNHADETTTTLRTFLPSTKLSFSFSFFICFVAGGCDSGDDSWTTTEDEQSTIRFRRTK